MYPRNAASPPRVAIGPVVQISDGAVQTSGCTVRIIAEGGAEGDGGGTTAYSTDGVVLYTPTQAETNYTAFVLIAKKTGCIPSSVTVVTVAGSTAGKATLEADQEVNVTKWGGTAIASAYVQANAAQFAGQTITCAGGVTIPAATLASTVNITAASGVTLAANGIAAAALAADALAAIGAKVEAMILDEGDATALLAAIAAKVETFLINEGDATATLAAIAAACNAAVVAGTVGTNVGAIKAKTDNLPASPAAVGSAMTLADSDGVTEADFRKLVMAVLFGKTLLPDSTSVQFLARDGVTVALTNTYSDVAGEDGKRLTSVIA